MRAVIGGLAASMLLAACSGDDDAALVPVDATPQALAAAVIGHYEQPVVAVAPRFERDDPQRWVDGQLDVELAFDRPEGDNIHVRVRVQPGNTFSRRQFAFSCRAQPCETLETDRGMLYVLEDQEAFESDPGLILAQLVTDRETIVVYGNGPLINDPLSEEAGELRDAVVATASDPWVGFTTSQAYAEAGAGISDDVWLEWFGGSPRPPDWKDWRAEDP